MTYREFEEVRNRLKGEKRISREDRQVICAIAKRVEACRVIPQLYDEKIERIKSVYL